MELEKICRLCLTIKKDMRNLFTENIISMLEEFCNVKISKEAGWPNLICSQCVHQVSRCHSFKKRIEKSDEQLKQYIKSLTVIVEEPMIKEITQQRLPEMKTQTMQQHIQEIQIQRPEHQQQMQQHPLIITNLNPTMINGQQLIQTANGQIIQVQGQFVQGPNNTIQMIATNTAQQPQLLQITRPEQDNRLTELIVQPTEMTEPQFYEEIPVVLQSANGQQTIVNLPHHQVQALQQQVQQQVSQMQQVTTSSSEQDEIEIHEVQNYDDDEYGCDDLEEVIEDDTEQEIDASSTNTTYYLHQRHPNTDENSSEIDQDQVEEKQLLAEFLSQHTISENPNKHVCNLCQQEFKHMKWLEQHMKSIHSNWIKANCKKQPQCNICHKSFRGPGMLKMHQKTHERENKLPTCSVCGKEFKSKSILYRHRATHFADQKPHICSICNKTFNSNYQLNAHVARHQKNHQCTQCEKCFPSASDLKNHIQQEHNEKKVTLTTKTS
ncbi:hypothetical protein ACKWTF_010841 [Chironomus riparius]